MFEKMLRLFFYCAIILLLKMGVLYPYGLFAERGTMKTKSLLAYILVFLLLFSLISCTVPTGETDSGEDTTTEALETTKKEDPTYVIVYSENAPSAVMKAVNDLKKAFNTLFSKKVTTTDDFLADKSDEQTDAYEICVGFTKRTATKTRQQKMAKGEYGIYTDNHRIVILGYDHGQTVEAVNLFISDYLPNIFEGIPASAEGVVSSAVRENTYISFLGDSITTFGGISGGAGSEAYNNTLTPNAIYYDSPAFKLEDTWWMRVISAMDYTLCVNNSYSGGRVTQSHTLTRAANLHNAENVSPDLVVIYYGINDYNNNVSLQLFSEKYNEMLNIIHTTYPKAEIYCCTLIPIVCNSYNRTTTPTQNTNGVLQSAFNEKIIAAATKVGAKIIDLWSIIGTEMLTNTIEPTLYPDANMATIDRVHPNANGMKLISDAVIARLQEERGN